MTDPVNSTFWHWFAAHERELAQAEPSGALVAQLDRRVRSVGDLGWELGPGYLDQAASLFAISPLRDPAKLPVTQAVVAEAPDLPRWEIYPVKPPRHLKALLINLSNPQESVDCGSWEYRLHMRGKIVDTLEFMVVGEASSRPSKAQDAAVVLAEGILGELTLLRHVERVVATQESECPSGARGIQVADLRSHFASLGLFEDPTQLT